MTVLLYDSPCLFFFAARFPIFPQFVALSEATMGVLQNLKLWENNVTFIDENGEMVTKKMPRVAPAAPWKVVGLLTLENWIFFIVGL